MSIVKNNNYKIYIDSAMSNGHQIEVLIHEWAHIKMIDVILTENHSEDWGRMYAKIYSTWEKDFK